MVSMELLGKSNEMKGGGGGCGGNLQRTSIASKVMLQRFG